ncbi:hypothetical protein GCM10022206_84460 [Streptomyces chiangmaiensis]
MNARGSALDHAENVSLLQLRPGYQGSFGGATKAADASGRPSRENRQLLSHLSGGLMDESIAGRGLGTGH